MLACSVDSDSDADPILAPFNEIIEVDGSDDESGDHEQERRRQHECKSEELPERGKESEDPWHIIAEHIIKCMDPEVLLDMINQRIGQSTKGGTGASMDRRTTADALSRHNFGTMGQMSIASQESMKTRRCLSMSTDGKTSGSKWLSTRGQLCTYAMR